MVYQSVYKQYTRLVSNYYIALFIGTYNNNGNQGAAAIGCGSIHTGLY